MAKDHSFDVESEVNFQEVTNAVEQSRKEITTRYDFKGSNAKIDWVLADKKITLSVENEMKLKAVVDILQGKFVKRGLSIKAIEYGNPERATGGSLRQVLTIQSGIPTDKAREIVKYIKTAKLKVQSQIQEAKVRVQSSKIDTLQETMKLLKVKNFGLDLQFTNYR